MAGPDGISILEMFLRQWKSDKIMENTLYIIDGHGLIYRAYYAFIRRPLFTTKGENTSALFGGYNNVTGSGGRLSGMGT